MAQVGSVGSAIGAALETAGQYMQGEMLHALDGGAAVTIGLLFYSIAAIGALLIMASGGSYKHALTFLIGPPVFYFLISPENRIYSDGANWQSGLEVTRYNQLAVGNALRGVTDEQGFGIQTGNKIVVTKFFALWDRIVSRTVQSFTHLVRRFGDENSDLTFMNKTERYVALFQQGITDPALKELVHNEVVLACGDYFQALIYLHTPALSQSMDQITKNRLTEKIARYEDPRNAQINIRSRPQLAAWIERTAGVDPSKEVYTCKEMWTLSIQHLLRSEADRLIDRIASTGLPIDMVNASTPAERREKIEELSRLMRAKMADKVRDQTSMTTGSVKYNPTTEDVDVMLVNEVAARLLLRELTNLDPNMAQLTTMDRTDIRREKVGDQSYDISQSLREIGQREEWMGKGDVVTAALTIPYVQGLALYFLAMFFPFFALAIVIPGRHSAFLQWMSLWFWVKSWDIGYAIAAVFDDFLYLLMPHGPPITNDVVNDPGTLIKSIYEVDPTYSVNTYYMIIAALMLSVPVLSGFLVKKGANDLMGAITNGAQRFASKTGNAMALVQGSTQAQTHINDTGKQMYSAINPNGRNETPEQLAQSIRKHLESSPEAWGSLLASAGGAKALQSYLQEAGLPAQQIANITSELTKRTGDQLQAIGLARNQYDLAQTLRDEGLSYQNRRMAALAVMNGYYSHDGTYPVPIEDYIGLVQARNTYQAGGAISSGVANLVRAIPKLAMGHASKPGNVRAVRSIGEWAKGAVATVAAGVGAAGVAGIVSEATGLNHREASKGGVENVTVPPVDSPDVIPLEHFKAPAATNSASTDASADASGNHSIDVQQQMNSGGGILSGGVSIHPAVSPADGSVARATASGSNPGGASWSGSSPSASGTPKTKTRRRKEVVEEVIVDEPEGGGYG